MNKKTLNKSISELEGWKWTNDIPTSEDSFVVRKSYELHNKKLKDYTGEDLRFSIGQKEGLEYIVPLAMNLLREDIFVETDFYKGALLENVLKLPQDYWKEHPDQKKELEQLFIENQQQFEELETTEDIKTEIREAFEEFLLNK